MKLLIKKLHPNAKFIQKREGDSGYDLYTTHNESVLLNPGEIFMFPTGIAMQLPFGYGFILRERGSTGTKGISVRAGVVDCSYRAEIFVAIQNTNNKPILFTSDDKTDADFAIVYPLKKAIAQGLIVKTAHFEIEEVKELENTDRGAGKLGSTGN